MTRRLREADRSMYISNDLPPVVLLHGFATSTDKTWREPGWFDLIHDAGRRAIGIDLLGHGEAPKPTDPAAYSDLASPVIAEIPEGPFDIIGYSLGARTAIEIALAEPSRVRKMVLAAVGRNVMIDSQPSDDPSGGMADHIIERFGSLISAAGDDAEALRACMSVDRAPFTPELLAGIDIPCLVIMGDDDFAGPPEPLADALPDATVVTLANVDHFGLPKQFPFIDAALEFIDAVPTWD